MLSPKENLLRVLNHQEAEYVPCGLTDQTMTGFSAPFEKGPPGGGLDAFGVEWTVSDAGSFQPLPAPGKFVLTDITQWKKRITIPNPDDFDWEKDAARDLAPYDTKNVVVDYGSGNGIFERLAAFMGFEEALAAMWEEPDAVDGLFAALTDFKIKVAEKAKKYYKAESFTIYDDIATERDLFMSPEIYRALIKPHHKRLYDAIRNLGMIPIQHTCGHMERVIEDLIEIGVAAWTSVQPSNDIKGLLQKYGNKIVLMGGFDTTGKPARSDATEDEIKAEVNRCYAEYGPYKNAYVFFGFRMVKSNNPMSIMLEAMQPIAAACVANRQAGK
jgi:hypothetical protein